MNKKAFTTQLFLTAAALASSSFVAAQTTAPATIPTSFQGTYNMTYANAQANSPLPNGATATMVLTSDGVLCIADYVLTKPVLENGNPAEAIWSAPEAGVKLAVSNINTGNFNEVNVATMNNVWLGQLQGSKVSNNTDCGISGGNPNFTDVNKIVELAEEKFGDIFPSGALSYTYRIIQGNIHRAYASTQVNLVINNGGVFVSGGQFGSTPVSVGTLASVIAQLTGQDVTPDIPEGDFNLTISGTVQAIVLGFAGPQTPISITLEKIPAPNANDINALENAIRDAMKDAGTINSLVVTTVSVSSSKVIFDVTFSGTAQSAAGPVTSNYVLRYEYTKI